MSIKKDGVIMITIFDDTNQIPEGIEYVKFNDAYFGYSGIISDNEDTRLILKTIDKCEYNNHVSFYNRCGKDFGALSKEHLSTGTKTLLNIINNPDKCFDLIELGHNAFELLAHLSKTHDGYVYSEAPLYFLKSTDDTCSFKYKGKMYDHYFELFDTIYYDGDFDE